MSHFKLFETEKMSVKNINFGHLGCNNTNIFRGIQISRSRQFGRSKVPYIEIGKNSKRDFKREIGRDFGRNILNIFFVFFNKKQI
jgi:hypothetical protein